MKRLLPLMLILLLCAGCAALPAEERSFAVALALSRSDDGWTIHARIPTYQTGGGYTTVTGEGTTLDAALSTLDAAAPMQLHLGQLRLLVFPADTASTPAMQEALAALADRPDLRAEASVAVTEAELSALMEALEPSTGARLSKSLDVLIETRLEQGVAPEAKLSDILLMGERQQPVLMGLTLEDGAVGLFGGWPVSKAGVVSQRLAAGEMQLLSLMQGRLTSGTLTLQEGTVRLSGASAEMELSLPTLQDARVTLKLRIASAPLTEEALSHAVATACLGVLGRLCGMGCDALGLARHAIVHAETMEDWHDMNWPERYRDMTWSVRVGVEGPA